MFVYQQNDCLNITFEGDDPVVNPTIRLDVIDNQIYVNDLLINSIVEEKLDNDITFNTAEVVTDAKTVVLNGHTISCPEDTVGDGVYHITSGGYLTIEGTGVINGIGKNDYNMAIWSDGGHVVINGGHFTNVGCSGGGDDHFDLIYAKNGGIIEINDGFFECQTPRWTVNNNNTQPGKIIIRGGTFVDFDPSNTNTDEPDGNNFVADGYKVVKNNNLYTVVKI